MVKTHPFSLSIGLDELQTAKVLTSYEKEAQEANGTIKEMLYKKHVRSGLLLGLCTCSKSAALCSQNKHKNMASRRHSPTGDYFHLAYIVLLYRIFNQSEY